MKSKLTLSLPEKAIREAKQIAKMRRTTVSALFEWSLDQWKSWPGDDASSSARQEDGMADLIGVLRPQSGFDARSTHTRRKHE